MEPNATFVEVLNRINHAIVNPVLILMFTLSLFMFFWGIVELIANPADQKVLDKGKRNMIWGLFGMLIMVSAYGIIALILSTFQFSAPGYIPV